VVIIVSSVHATTCQTEWIQLVTTSSLFATVRSIKETSTMFVLVTHVCELALLSIVQHTRWEDVTRVCVLLHASVLHTRGER
jgi:hypothetical protein